MNSLKQLDLVLGEILEYLVKAVSQTKSIEINEKNKFLMRFGRVIAEMWEIRNEIYKIDPSLKIDSVREIEQDKDRFNELSLLQNRAYEFEHKGEKEFAKDLYEDLLNRSKIGYFRQVAEAGLYRLMIE